MRLFWGVFIGYEVVLGGFLLGMRLFWGVFIGYEVVLGGFYWV